MTGRIRDKYSNISKIAEEFGFEIVSERDVEEFQAYGVRLLHKKTGADLLLLKADDPNKTFGISFPTPPWDSSGVAHILEHTVLTGSKKYPLKDPFMELAKTSLKTFLNAMTYPDRTVYPVSSTNERDFFNLTGVYLDAVFFPLLDERSFQQEGWNYEIRAEDDPLRYGGVVYSEMKGVYDSPDRELYRRIDQSLFPDTAYGFCSGGYPEAIPSLTYERFVEFHQSYYHPSNSQTYFYGDAPIERELEIASEYFDNFEKKAIDGLIPAQNRIAKKVSASFPYGVKDEKESAQCYVTANWLCSPTNTVREELLRDVLEHVLAGHAGAPLRNALLSSGLGDKLVGGGFFRLREWPFVVGLRGVKRENTDKVIQLVDDTLQNFSDTMPSSELVEGALNSVEFSLSRMSSDADRGMRLYLSVLPGWMFGECPLTMLQWRKPFEELRAEEAKLPEVLSKMVASELLENPHKSEVILYPDETLLKEQEKTVQAELEKAKSELSGEEVKELIQKTVELEEFQRRVDPPESFQHFPKLTREDLNPDIQRFPFQESAVNGVGIYSSTTPTGGIRYTNLLCELGALSDQNWQYLPFLCRLLSGLGTTKRPYAQYAGDVSRFTGGVGASPTVFGAFGKEEIRALVSWGGECLPNQYDELLSLMVEPLEGLGFNDTQRAGEMLSEMRASLERGLMENGHSTALSRLQSYFDGIYSLSERLSGLGQLDSLRSLEKDFQSSSMDKVVSLLESTLKEVLSGANFGMQLIVQDEEELQELVSRNVERFREVLSLGQWTQDQASPFRREKSSPMKRAEGIFIPAQVNYVATGLKLFKDSSRYHGSMRVAERILSTEYLWKNVREEGGAYGAFASVSALTGTMTICSYRDPHVERTLSVYDGIADYFQKIEMTHDRLEQIIIGVIGSLDRPLSPSQIGHTAFVHHMTGNTEERRQKVRKEILSTTVEDLRNFGRLLAEQEENRVYCVVGSEAGIRASRLAKESDFVERSL